MLLHPSNWRSCRHSAVQRSKTLVLSMVPPRFRLQHAQAGLSPDAQADALTFLRPFPINQPTAISGTKTLSRVYFTNVAPVPIQATPTSCCGSRQIWKRVQAFST